MSFPEQAPSFPSQQNSRLLGTSPQPPDMGERETSTAKRCFSLPHTPSLFQHALGVAPLKTLLRLFVLNNSSFFVFLLQSVFFKSRLRPRAANKPLTPLLQLYLEQFFYVLIDKLA